MTKEIMFPVPITNYLPEREAIDYGRKEYIYKTGSRGLYLVVSGHVRVYTLKDDGREAHIGFYGPGHVFGESCLMPPMPLYTSETAYAYNNKCQTQYYPLAEVLDLIESTNMAVALVDILVTRLGMLQVDHSYGQKISMERLYGVLVATAAVLGNPFRATDLVLATMFATSREIITSKRAHLQRVGLIDKSRSGSLITVK